MQTRSPDDIPREAEILLANRAILAGRLEALPASVEALPPGWMSDLELRVLYNLARECRGDLLEIGSWVGRSTAALAMGIRDGEGADRHFDVVDLGFVSVADFARRLNANSPVYLAQPEIAGPIEVHGGVIGSLIDNLQQRDLLQHVTSIIRGEAAQVPLRASYQVVFCDATHTVSEIDNIGPTLSSILSPSGLLMCDDITEPILLDALLSYVELSDTIFLNEIDDRSKSIVGRIKATQLP